MISLVLLVLILYLYGLSWAGDCSCNCYTVIVGKEASENGAVLLAHNEDDGGDLLVNIRKIKRLEAKMPLVLNLKSGRDIKISPVRFGLLWFEVTEETFGDSFVNEYGVAIVSNACGSKEVKQPYPGGISYFLRRLVIERARTAREAVKLLGKLVEKYGYDSSGRTYSIIDREEGWVVAVVRGKIWVAQRVDDDKVVVIPNHYVIRKVDLKDKKRFMGSANLVKYAIEKGWYDPHKDGEFDFARVYSLNLKHKFNVYRHWRGLELLSGKKWDVKADFPFQVKPAKKISVRDLIRLLRDHYEGTRYDVTEGYKKGSPNKTEYRPICVIHTKYALVIENRKNLPAPVATLVWLSIGKPDTSVFLPLYYGVDPLPVGMGLGSNAPDYDEILQQHFNPAEFLVRRDQLLFNKIRLVERLVEKDYGRLIKILKREYEPLEESFFRMKGFFEKNFLRLYEKDIQMAQHYLNSYFHGAFSLYSLKVNRVLNELLEARKVSAGESSFCPDLLR